MSSTRTTPPTHTIVEYFYPPESKGHRCGYCKSQNSNFSHGMWAHTISPDNYERLINIGWRRSGSYLYKPMNEKVCCPMYTIRNLSSSVEISRSQRKVLKRFKRYLTDGVQRKVENKDKMEVSEEDHDGEVQPEVPEKRFGISRDEVGEMVPKESDRHAGMKTLVKDVKPKNEIPVMAKKPHPLKKKHLRRERKRQKLIAKGEDPDEFFKRNERNRVAELDGFFGQDQADKLSFSTKLVKVDSDEFEEHFEVEHSLYQKYQMHTHGDTADECRASQFRRFLCDNPFKYQDEDTDPESETPQGTFHQHYYINSTLIAVGVIDILPHCVSSVYFFYDPDYSFLSPGTLGALHEISFVNHLNKSNPLLKYYYLGFYIHNCVKMRYKRKFRPCELVCPFTLQWVRFDERVIKLLDEKRYARLNESGGDDNKPDEDVQQALLLYNRRVYSYNNYPYRTRDEEELQSYVNLVSAQVASNMLLYRSSQ